MCRRVIRFPGRGRAMMAAVMLAVSGAVTVAFAQMRPPRTDIEAEFKFAAALVAADMNDYAAFLAARLARTYPEIADRATVVRAEALVAARQFEQAAAIIGELPAASPQSDAVRLALADGYYRVGEIERSRTLYRNFFARQGDAVPEDPDLLRFYRLAAYKFAQMLLHQNDLKGSVRTYDLLIAATTDDAMLRQIRLEQAEVLLRHARQTGLEGEDLEAVVEKVKESCNAVIWGGMDLWFGRAVICLAEVEALALREDEAVRLLQTNLGMLRTLDDTLAEADIPMSESPLAGARSILGNLYEREAGMLLGDTAQREGRALLDLGRAFTEAEALWALIGRIHRQDQGIVQRSDGRTDILRGTTTERHAAFLEMDALLTEVEDLLRTGAEGEAWSAPAAGSHQELAARIKTLREALAAYPRDLGVTPSVELAFGPRFEGRDRMERARRWLGPADARRTRAVELHTLALQQFYSIFASYPDSAWSEDAGVRVEQAKDRLEALTGKTVTIRMAPGSERKLARVHLSEGHDLFSREQYARAVDAYLKGLELYPEGEESVVALVGLMECQTQLENTLDVEVIATYLAERFAGVHTAAQGLLRTGRHYFEKQSVTMYERIYTLFTENFQEHAGAETILFMLGEQRWKEKDYLGAGVYYARLAERYPRGAHFRSALERLAWAPYLLGDFAQAAERFKTLLAHAHPGLQKAQAQLSYADCLRQTGNYGVAIREYRELMTWLTQGEAVYTREDLKGDYRKLHEQSVFFQAYCLSRLDRPADRVTTYRNTAIRLYQEFADQFPDSELAPTALSSMGALYIAQEDTARAARVYSDLTRRYPQSEAGRNSRLAMVRSLVDVGQTERARVAVQAMLADPGGFPPEHFLRIGLVMLDQGLYGEAAQALDLSIVQLRAEGGLESNPGMEQRALLGAARAWLAQDDPDKAIAYANTLMERYPQSAFFYEMRFVLGQAYGRQGQTDRAIEVMREVFQRATDPLLMNRATLALGRIQEAGGQTAEALASYQRIVLLADANDSALQAIFETALGRSVVLLAQMERWRETLETARLYNNRYPEGAERLAVRQAQTRARVQTGAAEGDEP